MAQKPHLTLLAIIKFITRFFQAFGAPPLFLIKILLWAVYWFYLQGKRILSSTLDIVRGTVKTFTWFLSLVLKFPYQKHFNRAKKPLDRSKKVSGKIIKTLSHNFLIFLAKIKSFVANSRQIIPRVTQSVKKPTLPVVTFPTSNHRYFYFISGFIVCFLVVFLPFLIINYVQQLPHPKNLANGDFPVTTKIYDRNRNLLYQIYAEENRTPIKLAQLPKYVLDATIAIEDKNFYRHTGFDLQGIARAFIANLRGKSTQGGSTITQQLIKSALLSPERTYERKIKEVILSFWAERMYSKDKILEMYLNQIPYGGSSYGIEAASQTYFNKHAAALTLGEAALLAGLPSAPSVYSPFGTHPEMAKSRQGAVIQAMQDQNFITPLQAQAARNEVIRFAPLRTDIKAPHFVMYVKDWLVAKYGIKMVEQGGLEVVTTLDLPTAEMVDKEIRDGVEKQKSLRVGNGAAIVTKPATGEILAMTGSKDYFDENSDGNVNVVIAQRSPGSSIKPLTYAAAMDRGLISPATIWDDSPTNFLSAGSPPYSPQNYDNKFHGKVTTRVALASSYNIPAVKILAKLGMDNFINKSREMGLKTLTDPSRYGLSLTLGGGEITMWDMATAYGTFANSGIRVDLNPIISVTDYRGRNLESRNLAADFYLNRGSRVLSSQTTFLISDILSDNGARTPAFGPVSALVIPGKTVAVKTGTAESKRDNWTIGYTPSVLAAVWVGNNDNSPMSPYLESGNTGAAAVWHNIMVNLLKDKADEKLARPQNLIAVEICAINGLLPCENCPATKWEYFVPGTQPVAKCQIEKKEEEKK